MVRRALTVIMAIGAAACILIMAQRWSQEQANRTVELSAEWPELRSLSAVLRVPMPDLLRHFRDGGLSSVALQEQTIHELVDDGQIFRPDPFTDRRVQELTAGVEGDAPRKTVLAFPDESLRSRIEQNLAVRWGADRVHPADLGNMPALVVDGEYAQFRDLGVGVDPIAREQLRAAGLGMVGRVKNYPALTPAQLRTIVDNLKAAGAHAVVFSGDDVLGNPNLIHDTAADLEAAGLGYGYVEFGKQHGDDRLATALEGKFIRVHTIQGAELSNMTPDAAVARFVKATRERDIRLCYIHLLSSVTGGTLEGDEDFVHRIALGMEAAGYQPGIARVRPRWSAARIALSLAACGLAASAALLLGILWGGYSSAILGAALLLMVALLAAITHVPAQQGAALLAALIFPVLALIWTPAPTDETSPRRLRRPASGIHQDAAAWALTMFLRTCLFSMLGALYIIGFLGSSLYMTKTDQFLGIKFAIILPVLAVFLIYWGRLLDPAPPAERWVRLKTRFASAMNQPLQVGQVLTFIIVVAVLGLVVARSGNDSAVGASFLELKTRRLMDGILIARPRTKEVLLGHPALFLAFYAVARRWWRWVVPLISVGALGQSSLVNTFCHIHTPLYISVFHFINGLWLGCLIGWALTLCWDRIESRRMRRTGPVGVPRRPPLGSPVAALDDLPE